MISTEFVKRSSGFDCFRDYIVKKWRRVCFDILSVMHRKFLLLNCNSTFLRYNTFSGNFYANIISPVNTNDN